MSPINFQLYEELPEPVFLQLQRQQREKEQAEKKALEEKTDNCYKSEHEKKPVTDI